MKRRSFLVFSDLHLDIGSNLYAIRSVASAILKHKPDYIVCTGDIGDFKSLNKKVKNRKYFSTEAEIAYVVETFSRCLFKPLAEYNDKRRQQHKKLYKPDFVVCFGNHDEEVQEELRVKLKKLAPVPFYCCDYKEIVQIGYVSFSHVFEDGISGKNCTTPAQILENVRGRSISGHQHRRAIVEKRGALGWKDFSIILPCCNMESPEWAGQGVTKWDRGYLLYSEDPASDWFEYLFKELPKPHYEEYSKSA